jgi:hypothetical protein
MPFIHRVQPNQQPDSGRRSRGASASSAIKTAITSAHGHGLLSHRWCAVLILALALEAA